MVDTPFVDPGDCNNSQVAFLFVIYAYVLYSGSNMISDGSELLQLIPAIAGIVGSIVLPILGAVPDGMMVLFSGLGPDAQEQVAVGVGALAGSTIMLLTLPWFLAIFGGRVSIVAGVPQYKKPAGAPDDWEKLDPNAGCGLFSTGVGVDKAVSLNAKLMLLTALIYLIIQVPATFAEKAGLDTLAQSNAENFWASIGLVVCIACFCGYLVIMYLGAKSDPNVQTQAAEKMIAAIKKKKITIRAVMADFKQKATATGGALNEKLLDTIPKDQLSWMKRILWPFFTAYDVNQDHKIDMEEFKLLIKDLGESTAGSGDSIQKAFRLADADSSGKIEFEEFVKAIMSWALDPKRDIADDGSNLKRNTVAAYMEEGDDDEDGEGEEEDVPEDLADLSPEEQQRRILMRSFWQMGMGTLLVLFFSDPMVDVLSELGNRTGVPKFYVAFVLAPLASNASELIAAYNYAQKRTQKAMSISLSTLCGAACMNNTFCLAIFLALVKFRDLAWQFTAETISIVAVQYLIGILVLSSNKQTLGMGVAIMGLYPLSLVVVYYLENVVGID
jgi:Ca2+/Na+ antiporter